MKIITQLLTNLKLCEYKNLITIDHLLQNLAKKIRNWKLEKLERVNIDNSGSVYVVDRGNQRI